MTRAFGSDKWSVRELFSQHHFFRVPVYQRAFSWTTENFDDLISDIKSADRTAEYFLGTIVLHKTSEPGNYDIVDGQQRLASITLLLACFRDLIDDDEFSAHLQDKLVQKQNELDGIPEKNRLEVKDGARFNPLVAVEGGTVDPQPLASETPSGARYLDAIRTFREKLVGLPPEELKALSQFLNQKCIVIALSASNFEEAFRLFTIVNDRGKQLRRIDILKAANLDPSIVTSEGLRTSLAHKWETLENDIGDSEFESVFFAVRLILLKDKPQRDLYREFEERIFAKNVVARGEPFFELAFNYANIYRRLFIDGDFVPEGDKDYAPFVSLLHIMNNEFAASEWRAALMFYAKKFGTEEIYDFLLALEKAFLTDWVKSIRKDERFQTYAKILTAIEEAKKPQAVIKSITFDEAEIRNAVKGTNFYGAAYAKYFLLRLELVAGELDGPRRFKAKSIEHVLPQHPEEGGEWLSKHKATEIDQYVHTIGNLVLLSRSRNSSASNREFGPKKETYLKPNVSDYPRSIQVITYPEWTKAVIEARTETAATDILKKI